MTTGRAFFTHTDAVVGDLVFTRTFNSGHVSGLHSPFGMFGPGWNSSFEVRLLKVSGKPTVVIRAGGGDAEYYYDPDGNGEFALVHPESKESWVTAPFGSTYERHFRSGGREIYDLTTGKLLTVEEASGTTTTYAYDAQGRLSTVTRSGRSIVITYSGTDTRPRELRGPGNVLLAKFTYHPSTGRLQKAEYPDGSQWTGYQYTDDSAGRVKTVMDLEGKRIEAHDYETGTGRALTSETGDGVDKLTLTYETPDRTSVRDALDNVTVYEHALVRGIRKITRITGPCPGCGGAGDVQEWTYDAEGRIASYRNGSGADAESVEYTYHAGTSDLKEEKRRPSPSAPLHVTSYTYYPETDLVRRGRVWTRTDPSGAVTTFDYGPAGPTSITEQIAPGRSRTTTISYLNGKPQYITDPRQKVWELSFNATGDLEWTKDPTPLHNQTSFLYDAMGRRTGTVRPPTTPPIEEPTIAYTTRGWVKRIVLPDETPAPEDNPYTEFTYDGSGRRRSVRDPLGRMTDYRYDDWGRLRYVDDAQAPQRGTTEYKYDFMSNLEYIVDARNKETRFHYQANRLTGITYPGGTTEQFTHDTAGRLRTRTDRRGVVTTFAYDGLGRLTGKTYSDGTPAVTFHYDAATAPCPDPAISQRGRLTAVTNSDVALRWCYDLAGQVVTATTDRGGTRTITYEYDDAGNRTGLTLDAEAAFDYTWEDRGLLETITGPGGTYTFLYDNAARRKSMQLPNGALTTYEPYDKRSRLTAVRTTLGASVLSEFTYPLYDLLDNRLQRGGATAPAETYAYDEIDRLRSVARAAPTEVFTYDKVGNRLSALGTTGPWTYSDRNELLSVGSPATATFDYHANGSLWHKTEAGNTWTYEWDGENRLKQVLKNGAQVASYVYDGLGRRAQRTVGAVLGDSDVHDYVYDGEDILREGFSRPWDEGGIAEPGPHIYVHGPGIDEPLAVRHGDQRMWYAHADGLGSVAKLTDAVGATVVSYQYDAFGNLESGSATGGYAFTGREWDPETGLYYYRARYYDPKIGRFLSEDPLRWNISPNFYPYVANNPVNYRDPYGLQAVSTWCRNCSTGQATQVQSAVQSFCTKTQSGKCRAAIQDAGLTNCVSAWCSSNIPVTCQGSCGACGGPCITWPGVEPTMQIYLQQDAFTNDLMCGPLSGTIAHEFAHLCGVGPDVGAGAQATANRIKAATIDAACETP